MGPEFFRSAPRRPGVYVMTGARGEVLYVGQSGNLRTRLNCYKNGNPNMLPRRIVRLIHSVASITWEECASRQLARVRENELLRLHRPKFNRVNTYPQAYGFIGVAARAEELTLFRLNEPPLYERDHWGTPSDECGVMRDSGGSQAQTSVYGAFKGGAVYGFGSLLRVLWSAIYQPVSPFDLPRQLLTAKAPMRFTVATPRSGNSAEVNLIERIHGYLSGESKELIEWLTAAIQTKGLSVFHRNFIQADVELLASFFETGPRRIRELKREHGIEQGFVGKEELDDLIALSARKGL